jgi:hypothetical protein
LLLAVAVAALLVAAVVGAAACLQDMRELLLALLTL